MLRKKGPDMHKNRTNHTSRIMQTSRHNLRPHPLHPWVLLSSSPNPSYPAGKSPVTSTKALHTPDQTDDLHGKARPRPVGIDRPKTSLRR